MGDVTKLRPAVFVVRAHAAVWEDLQTVFGTRGAAAWCRCQQYRLRPREAFQEVPRRGTRPLAAAADRMRPMSPSPGVGIAGCVRGFGYSSVMEKVMRPRLPVAGSTILIWSR